MEDFSHWGVESLALWLSVQVQHQSQLAIGFSAGPSDHTSEVDVRSKGSPCAREGDLSLDPSS